MKITVAIPHYNDAENLDKLLGQLSEKGFDQVLVLDDNSTDDAVRQLAQKYPYAEFVFGDANLGPGGNRNRVIGRTQADLIWFLDSDMEIKTENPRAEIEKLFVKNMRQVVGTLILGDGNEPMWWNYGYFTHPEKDAKFCSLAYGRKKDQAARDTLRELGWDYAWIDWLGEKSVRRKVDWSAEGSLIVPAKLFEPIGGYDEEFKYHEGQDLTWRLREAGAETFFDPAIVVSHKATRSRRNEIDLADEEAARVRFYKRAYGDSVTSSALYSLMEDESEEAK